MNARRTLIRIIVFFPPGGHSTRQPAFAGAEVAGIGSGRFPVKQRLRLVALILNIFPSSMVKVTRRWPD